MTKCAQRCGVALDVVCEAISDARDFLKVVFANRGIRSTPHIYISVLPGLWRGGAAFSAQLLTQTQALMRPTAAGDSGTEVHWLARPPLATFAGYTTSVASVSFSSDDTRILSSSSDSTCCVWNSLDGSPMAEPVRWHEKWVPRSGGPRSPKFRVKVRRLGEFHLICAFWVKNLLSWNL
jgi:WD40 repeat protein